MLRISFALDSAIKYRRQTRMFGDIDNNIPVLSATEIISDVMESCFKPETIQSLFERDSSFYTNIRKK